MQRTLGIVSFSEKEDILDKISIQDTIKIVYEKKFELSVQSANLVLNKEIKESQIVFGFILEGLNAIEDWLHIIRDAQSKSLFHGSLNPDNAQSEIDWFQNGSTQSSKSSFSSASSASSSSIPVKVTNNRKNVIKKTTTSTKQSSVSGTTSPHQRKLGLRDTTSSPDGPRNSLRKPTPIVRNSKIPNTKTTTPTTTTTPLKTSRNNNAANSKIANATSRTTTTSKPITKTTTTSKQLPPRRSELNGRRGSLVTATATTTTKKLTTTTKGGVSKNTPPTSVITGRTRKYSKVTEKKPVSSTTATKLKKEKPVVVEKEQVKEVDNEIKLDEVPVVVAEEEEDEAIVVDSFEENQDTEEVNKVEEESKEIEPVEKKKEIEQEEIVVEEVKQEPIKEEEENRNVLTQQPVSHPSTCSSADEHDAEVAAATSLQNTDTHHVKIAANLFQNSSRRSSSFSPNSVSSLPRPETPEVDQLRLRFENIIQTSSPATNELQSFPRRPSSKMSPEFISRIKEMKPKDPVGSKVKSMVELFMDENLNKWEF